MKKKVENRPFSRLSKWEKRVELAKDVIKQLKEGKLISKTGYYLNIDVWVTEENDHCQLNKLVSSGEATCKVCAKGSLFIAHVMRTNHLNLQEANYASVYEEKIVGRLKGIFTQFQLDMIESAFEKKVFKDKTGKLLEGDYPRKKMSPLGLKCIKFGKKYSKSRDRMVAIMKNIIRNQGEFIPR